ncbi:MAG: ABC transporter ATP-binding protein, partial [Clostridium sp.]
MIRLNKITKTYGDNKILDDMSYEFGDYGIACILGASGCGKTTLLNLIAGFDTQYSGKIDACGDCITQMNKTELCDYRKNHVGFVFQSYHLIRGYTVLENILLAAELNGKEQAVNIKNATELITKFGIKEKLNEKVENLSGGQKQRVAIARALINSPELLLADEPTGALDRETSTQIMNILKELSKDRLVIIITHDQKICEWADEIVTIDAGKMQVIALTQERETQVMPSNKKSFNSKPSTFKRACNNFKNHMSRYIAVSLAVALGLSFFMMSLSSKNLIK